MVSDLEQAPPSTRRWLAPSAYVLMLLAAGGAFLAIRSIGETLIAPPAPEISIPLGKTATGQVNVIAHVLTVLAAVIVLGHLLGRGFRYLGQPPVLGEIVAGILLGPSLLGAISPAAMHALVPDPAD